MSTGKVILGTVAGLAVGGILGILFAPEKGSVTRQQIMDKGNDYADELKSKYNEFADSISEKLQSGKEFVQVLAENGKAEFDEIKNDANHTESNYKL
jgi:gas vesicle protein